MNKKLKKIICSDLYRYGFTNERKIPFSIRKTMYGYKYTKLLRKCNFYKNNNKILFYFYRLLLDRYSVKYGIQISYSTKIGYGFYIGHIGTIVINYKTVIGNNVNISQGVTIGRENRGKREGAPNIGNNVWIGANATIVGNITIGDDVIIAPNTYVNFDVPSHSIVIGQRAKIINEQNCTYKYIENIVEE